MFDPNTRVTDFMTLIVTHQCNLNCSYCIDQRRGAAEMITLANVEKAITFAAGNGIKDILITGGEPTLHPDIVKIAKIIHDSSLRVIITTNLTNLDIIYELDRYTDCFNLSFYKPDVLPDPRIMRADCTLSSLIYPGRLDSRERLDLFIDILQDLFYLKFSTLAVNQYNEKNQHVDYLDRLPAKKIILFNEIIGQLYRGHVIKRPDQIINVSAEQSYKMHPDGTINKSW